MKALANTRDEGSVPGHLIAEVANAAAPDRLQPLTIAYWVGVTANWLPFAHSVLSYSAPGLGILMATAGLMTWFTALTVIVRFIPAPHRPELLPPRQRHPRTYPPWLRHILRNSPVPLSPGTEAQGSTKDIYPNTVR